ncbi:hypothetical protein [Aquimarina algiphila]|uniref:Uncharacterized protein n=1 Tax=Aquimarina algiphila TaxID=2047982 RepID=A0A554V9W5_9FLAO|nr:hypothetical protein [Aquimarina algiphila]TSE02305.1 hypothetical protein FOF46_31000 [Aquimarina algiphila]
MELHERLYLDIVNKYNLDLNENQILQLKTSCKKAIADNPNVDYYSLLMACKAYLVMIMEFPDLEL